MSFLQFFTNSKEAENGLGVELINSVQYGLRSHSFLGLSLDLIKVFLGNRIHLYILGVNNEHLEKSYWELFYQKIELVEESTKLRDDSL